MCTYYLLESTTLFEQKVIYTSAELEGGWVNAKQEAVCYRTVSQHFLQWNFFSDNT
jgi:hypothetical protein